MNVHKEKLIDVELDQWVSAGKTAEFWWRDDDAITVTSNLNKLTDLAGRFEIPVLIATIPAFSDVHLADYINSNSLLSAAVHGYAHKDHSILGQKKTEITVNLPDRDIDAVLNELTHSRQNIETLYGQTASKILVPPWNRIDDTVASRLSDMGFELVSTFSENFVKTGLLQLNCQLDLMHWKPVRIGKNLDEIFDELLVRLQQARLDNYAPIGILSHHLVHDENAWESCAVLMRIINKHSAIRVFSIEQFLSSHSNR